VAKFLFLAPLVPARDRLAALRGLRCMRCGVAAAGRHRRRPSGAAAPFSESTRPARGAASAALAAGATTEEIMEVLKRCVVQGVQACNLGVPILAEELERPGRVV